MYKVVEKALSIIKRWRILRGRVDILLVFKKYCVPPNGHVMLYLNINTSEIPNHFTLLFFAEKAQSYCSHSNGDCFVCKDIMFLLTWYFIVGYIIIIQCKIVVSIIFQASMFNIYRTYSVILDIQGCGESPLLCPFKLHFLSSTFAFYHLLSLSYKIEF